MRNTPNTSASTPHQKRGKYAHPTYDQARRIIAKFGGPARFADLLGISRTQAYKWSYTAPYGTDGLVPHHMVDRIQRAARVEGIVLTADDWTPTRVQYAQPDSVTNLNRAPETAHDTPQA